MKGWVSHNATGKLLGQHAGRPHLDTALQQVQLGRAWLAQGLALAGRSGLGSVILQHQSVKHHAAQPYCEFMKRPAGG